jgi:hypothetical protein
VSYIRFGQDGSDVYLFPTSYTGTVIIECCGCWLGGCCEILETQELAVEHIAAHRAEGHSVPWWVDGDILEDDLTRYERV